MSVPFIVNGKTVYFNGRYYIRSGSKRYGTIKVCPGCNDAVFIRDGTKYCSKRCGTLSPISIEKRKSINEIKHEDFYGSVNGEYIYTNGKEFYIKIGTRNIFGELRECSYCKTISLMRKASDKYCSSECACLCPERRKKLVTNKLDMSKYAIYGVMTGHLLYIDDITGRLFYIYDTVKGARTRQFGIIKPCAECGEMFFAKDYLIKFSVGAYCSHECVSDHRRIHPNDGSISINGMVRQMPWYQTWRKAVFNRDNYTCQHCGGSVDIILHAHHIKRVADIINTYNLTNMNDINSCVILSDINNGLTLCKECHIDVHRNKLEK